MEPMDENLSKSDLCAAREARGWSLRQVAQRLHITEAQVQGLEDGNYSVLPGATFARGYLKNYARILELDAEPFLQAFDAANAGSGLHPSRQLLPNGETPMLDYSKRVLVITALTVIAVIIVVWWLWGRNDNAANAPVVPPQPANPSMSLSSALAPAPKSIVTPSLPVSAAVSAPVARATSAPVAPTVSVAAPGIAFQFKTNCWVQVKDATGKTLLAVLGRPGDILKVDSGVPPYQVLVGNAQGVTIQYQGKPVALPVNALGVARLQLGTAPVRSGQAAVAPARSHATHTNTHTNIGHSTALTRSSAPVQPSAPAKIVLPAVLAPLSSAAVSDTASANSEASHAP